MLNNFIYTKKKSLFEQALNNGEVLDEAIVFIEDTKEIWNHDTYFDCSDKHITDENLNEVLSEYITETALNEKGYLTEHQSLDNYYTKDEINQQLGDINSILESIING